MWPVLSVEWLVLCWHFSVLPRPPLHSSFFLSPASKSLFVCICDVPCFQTHRPTPPSFLPPVSEFSFVMCRISKLANPLLPPPSSSPLASESSFATCHISELTNPLLPPPPSSPLPTHSLFATCHISQLSTLL